MKKSEKLWVQIVKDATGECALQMGPFTRDQAEHCRYGTMINLNHAEWSVLISATERKVTKWGKAPLTCRT
jgi:hypothetical protein